MPNFLAEISGSSFSVDAVFLRTIRARLRSCSCDGLIGLGKLDEFYPKVEVTSYRLPLRGGVARASAPDDRAPNWLTRPFRPMSK